MSSEPPPRLSVDRALQLVRRRFSAEPLLAAAELLLQRPGQRLVGVAPGRHADLLDVRERRLGDRSC